MAKDRYGYGTENKSYMDRFDKGEYEIPEKSVDLQEWRKKPWDNQKDIPLMKQALVSIFKGFHPDEKPWYVPKSSWREKRDSLLHKILTAASEKEGFPKDMPLSGYGLTNEMLGYKSK